MFNKILNNPIYKHYCLLHAAFRILCNSHFLDLFITEARKYLDSFSDIMPIIYDNTSLSINVHNLIHIVDDVEYFNCTLDNISAFPYENMLDKIRKLIRQIINLYHKCADVFTKIIKFKNHVQLSHKQF